MQQTASANFNVDPFLAACWLDNRLDPGSSYVLAMQDCLYVRRGTRFVVKTEFDKITKVDRTHDEGILVRTEQDEIPLFDPKELPPSLLINRWNKLLQTRLVGSRM